MKGMFGSVTSSSLPAIAIVILVVSITIGLGVVIVSVSYSGFGTSGTSHLEVFDVSNPSEDQECTLGFAPTDNSVSVEHFNGYEWLSVDSGYVSVDGKVVTVDSDGLSG